MRNKRDIVYVFGELFLEATLPALRDDEIHSEVMLCMWDSRVNFLTVDYRTFWYTLLFLCKLSVIEPAALAQPMPLRINSKCGDNE